MTQMNQNLLLTLFSPLINTIVILFFIFAKMAISANPQFLACSPATCGDGLNITFPFHIQDLQKPFCGFPGFNLSCNNNRPILKLQDNEFVISNIDYRNQIFRVSNAAVFDTAATCIPPFKNTSLPDYRFTLFSNQTTLFLLFDCNSTLNRNSELNKYAVGCLINETGPTLSMFSDNPHLGYASEVCEKNVLVPVDVDGAVDTWTTDGEELERVIERGFVLNWIASNCSICEASGGKCGFDYTTYHFKCFCPDRPHAWRCNPGNNKLRLKLGLGLGLAGGIGLLGLLLAIYITRRHYKKRNDSSDFLSTNSFSRSNLEGGGVYLRVSVFSYAELEKATSSFDNKKELGDGGFGTVYYGKLKDGREVAVKRLYQHNYKRVEQFMNEIDILTRLRHKNLVTLYGCTSRRCRELLLVYEYVPNGTVADHLHGDRAKSSTLTWPIRMSIAMETASALAYLHASDIIHRDVKTNNILLDKNFCVKVADFGLSRLFPNDVTHVSTAPQGTPGYVDPEYHQCYQLTSKSDVYSFGVVLVELISSMPAVDISRHRHEINLANFAVNKIQQCAFNELIDSFLGYGSDEEVKRTTILVAELAFRCLQQDKEMRPSMDEVLEELKRIESKEYREREEWLHDEREPPLAKTVPPTSPPNSDEASLLKSVRMPPPPSPDTVTAQWSSSSSTTPNISS